MRIRCLRTALVAALAFTLSMVADFTALLAALWILSGEKPEAA